MPIQKTDTHAPILICVSNRWNSAISEYALSAARAIELAAGTGRVYFVAKRGTPILERAARHGLAVFPVNGFGLSGVGPLLALVRNVRPGLAMAFGGPEESVLRLATNLPVVRFLGDDRPRQRLPFDRFFRPPRFQFVPCARLAPMAENRSALAGGFAVVRLGIDNAKFRLNPSTPAHPRRPCFLIVGRLDPVKGHERLMAAFAHAIRTWSDPEPRPFLHIVGEPQNTSVELLAAAAAAQRLTVCSDDGSSLPAAVGGHPPGGDAVGSAGGNSDADVDVVIDARRLPHIETRMGSAALGVIPSLGSEFICRVAQEFLLCGTPICVSDAGALRETLFSGAGSSYSLSDSAVTVGNHLRTAYRAAWLEAESVRRDRARSADSLFSLQAMGESLVGELRRRALL